MSSPDEPHDAPPPAAAAPTPPAAATPPPSDEDAKEKAAELADYEEAIADEAAAKTESTVSHGIWVGIVAIIVGIIVVGFVLGRHPSTPPPPPANAAAAPS